MTEILFNIFIIVKYLVAIYLVVLVVIAPLWIAQRTGKGKPDNGIVRLGALAFGWTGIGWLIALIMATKK